MGRVAGGASYKVNDQLILIYFQLPILITNNNTSRVREGMRVGVGASYSNNNKFIHKKSFIKFFIIHIFSIANINKQ